MRDESAVIARVCHDLITPFNAINLGLEAFEMSRDESLLGSLKESVRKANITLKFIRELFSEKTNTFCYSALSLKQSVAEYLGLYNVMFDLKSDMEQVPNVAGKIVMYAGVIGKETLPFGGVIRLAIDNDKSEIIAKFLGKNAVVPKIGKGEEGEVNYKNVIQHKLNILLKELGFETTICADENGVILSMKLK